MRICYYVFLSDESLLTWQHSHAEIVESLSLPQDYVPYVKEFGK